MIEKTCEEFASELAAKKPVPGGGGAAAYVGALAAALCGMAGNFTLGKKQYADVAADIRHLLDEADSSRIRLLSLVEEDANGFSELSAALKIPRDDPEYAKRVELATQQACKAPVNMMEECCHLIVLLEEMGETCSKLLRSDVACGAVFADAALRAACINVYVNTKQYAATPWAQDTEAYCNYLVKEFSPRAKACSRFVMGLTLQEQ